MHLSPSAVEVIADLAKTIRMHRERMLAADNRWIEGNDSRGSVDLQTAIDTVTVRSGYEGAERKDFMRAIRMLVGRTPAAVLERCSFRLLKGGRYLSVNAGNHLLFRLPAYSDAGTKQDADAFVVWPSRARLNNWSPAEQTAAIAFRFQLFDGITLTLSAREVLAMTTEDWRNYRAACEDALNCRRTRNWPSNVTIARNA